MPGVAGRSSLRCPTPGSRPTTSTTSTPTAPRPSSTTPPRPSALKRALGEERAKEIPISSTKSAIGHLLGAAGAVEAVATVEALRTGVIPPTLGYEVPDPELDLDYVPGEARPLLAANGRRAGSRSRTRSRSADTTSRWCSGARDERHRARSPPARLDAARAARGAVRPRQRAGSPLARHLAATRRRGRSRETASSARPARSTGGRSPATRRTARTSAGRWASAMPTRSSGCLQIAPGARGFPWWRSSSRAARGCRRAPPRSRGYGRIFRETVALTGVVPQISVVSGASAGGGAYSPALTDLILMTEDAAMFLDRPRRGARGARRGDRRRIARRPAGARAQRRLPPGRAATSRRRRAACAICSAICPRRPTLRRPGRRPLRPALGRPGRRGARRAAARVRRPRRRLSGVDRSRLAAGAVPALGAQRGHCACAARRPAGRNRRQPAATTSAGCSTPRARRRRRGSSASATPSGCR